MCYHRTEEKITDAVHAKDNYVFIRNITVSRHFVEHSITVIYLESHQHFTTI